MKEPTVQATKANSTNKIIRAREQRERIETAHADRMDWAEARRLERLSKRRHQ
jgi:hypothetical protein